MSQSTNASDVPLKRQSSLHGNVKGQCRNALISNADFKDAVSSSRLEDAASAAMDIVFDTVHQYFMARVPAVFGPSALDRNTQMLAALFMPGDVVKLSKGLDRGPNDGRELTGTVQGSTAHHTDGKTRFVIKWCNNTQSEESIENLHLVQKLSYDMGAKRGKLGKPSKPLTARQRQEALQQLKSDMLQFESDLPWTCVSGHFTMYRGTWIGQMQTAATVQQFVQAFRDLTKYLLMADDLPSAALKSTSPDFLESLMRAGLDEDVAAVQRQWREVIQPEFRSWMQVVREKHRPEHVRAGRAMLALETVMQHSGGTAFRQVPIAHILANNAQLRVLKTSLQRELDFCGEKRAEVAQAIAHGSPLTDQLLQGVTYGPNGLGGCYGGVPCARRGLLDGVVDFQGGDGTDDDADGSEATDLEDSMVALLEEGKAGDREGDDGVSSAGKDGGTASRAPGLTQGHAEDKAADRVGPDSRAVAGAEAAAIVPVVGIKREREDDSGEEAPARPKKAAVPMAEAAKTPA